eukprot:jgi/Botrbrau1/848/Bobra.0352s0042.1
MFYGAQVWDPVLIIAQIVTLQCLFYISLGLLLFLLAGSYMLHLTVSHFFDDKWVHVGSWSGWMVIVSNIANALAASIYFPFVVERAKKCLDFAATLYLLHLLIVSLSSHFPTSLTWWATNVVGFIITAFLGEFLCIQRELQEIPIGNGQARRRNAGLELLPKDLGTGAMSLTGSLFGRTATAALEPSPVSRASSNRLATQV